MAPGVVAVTGATGFVGRRTVAKLAAAGWQIRALTRKTCEPQTGVTWIKGALDNPASLEDLCKGADVILHIAGVVNAPDMAGFQAGNVTGTANMIAAARAVGVSRFIHISSLSARAPSLSNYGASKLGGEELVANSELDWTIIRPPGIYGPGDADMLDIFKMAQKGFVLLPPSGKISVIYVDDLAGLLVAICASDAGTAGHIWEVDDGREGGWTHREFAHSIGDAMGKRVVTFHAPRSLLFAAAYGDRLLRGTQAKLTPDRASYLSHRDWTIDPSRRPPQSLWEPQTDTRKGVFDTAQWYRAHDWI